jgi:nitrite reductase/ring-hydroxylating ferredoxin subunit
MIKVTGADRIGLFSVHKKDLKAVWRQLQMGSGHAFTKCFRACKSCVGSTHCRFGLMDSLGLGYRMGERYRGVMGPAKVKMAVSGCPRNCSEATIKDFGVVGVEGGWDLYIGGNGGAHVYVAAKIAQCQTDDEVIRIADRFYEYYRRQAKYGERTAHFIERVGLKTVADAILNAPEDALMELERSFQGALDHYRDPWAEGEGTLDNEVTAVRSEMAEGLVSVADVSEIPPGSSRLFYIGDTAVAVFHGRDGQWIAAHGVCPHKSGPIVDSIYGNGRLTCPLHNYSFDIATGQCDNPDIGALKIYKVFIRDGRVLVGLDA